MADDQITVLRDLARQAAELSRLIQEIKVWSDYVYIAVMQGDPRFTKAEFASPTFDQAAFDKKWASSGRAFPPQYAVTG